MKMKTALFYIMTFLVLSCLTGEQAELDIEHKVRIDQEGTRSESRHGYLIINGKALPDNFSVVAYDGVKYIFSQRQNMWGDDGYFPLQKALAFEPATQVFRNEDLALGWYEGSKVKKGTPVNWLYVEWSGGACFVSIDRIEDLIVQYKIPAIRRSNDNRLFME
ncbi:MAG: hypothetical protein EHM28_05330 [Spirochaetaceae bacterium]|nr:MAG: hypothetical protein EHM28_05330 [Spirochaetaceae bacterium]